MSYGRTLNNVPNLLKKFFRNFESNEKKIINSNWSLIFNESCLNENLWPKYTNYNLNVNLLIN